MVGRWQEGGRKVEEGGRKVKEGGRKAPPHPSLMGVLLKEAPAHTTCTSLLTNGTPFGKRDSKADDATGVKLGAFFKPGPARII